MPFPLVGSKNTKSLRKSYFCLCALTFFGETHLDQASPRLYKCDQLVHDKQRIIWNWRYSRGQKPIDHLSVRFDTEKNVRGINEVTESVVAPCSLVSASGLELWRVWGSVILDCDNYLVR